MQEQQWTLERELCDLTGTSDLRNSLVSLGIVLSSAGSVTVSKDCDWTRSGAETYSYKFTVHDTASAEFACIIKACVAFNPSESVAEILKRWCDRRSLLSSVGVEVPRLFFAGTGLLIEELIPWQLQERLMMHGVDSGPMLIKLAEYAGHLARLGFAPVGAFSDLRSRGSDVVVVDFGADLGEPGVTQRRGSSLLEDLLNALRAWKEQVDMETLIEMRAAFSRTARGKGSLHVV